MGKPGRAKGARSNKYNAAGRHVEGHWCASDAEAVRCEQLLAMQAAGRIANLRMQPRTQLVVENVEVCAYIPDFAYDVVDEFGDQLRAIVEDVKGMMTPVFALKWKLFNALQPTPLTVISPSRLRGSRGEFMRMHWENQLPLSEGHWKTPHVKK